MKPFEELMATLKAIDAEADDLLTKSQPEAEEELAKSCSSMKKAEEVAGEDDDEKVAAAADESTEGEGTEQEKEGEYEKDEEKPLAKSFTSEDGEELIDATEILENLQKSFTEHDSVLAMTVGLLDKQNKQLQQQNDLIKSMQETLAAFGTRGAGRKSTVTVLAKSHVATQNEPEQAPQVTRDDLLLKANNLFDQKLLTGLQLTQLDVALRHGYAPDPNVLAILAKH